ncbi:MAG: PHB depolymerase family esterase [Vicinamibacterales bacterium]
MRSTALVPALALVAATALVTALGAQTRPAPDTDRDAPLTIRHGGRDRTYLLHDFSGGRRAPLVIVLHGGGGNAGNAVRMTSFDAVGARERLVVVYPNGTAARSRVPLLTWNAGHCCASAMRERVDDVGFIAALIDREVAAGRADPSRAYVTGMSNGGMMAHRLGRELSAKIAAIAPVVGAVFGDEPAPAGPVAAFIVVGADDRVVPGEGGPLDLRALIGRAPADHDVAPAIEQARYWARANRCGQPAESRTAATTRTAWTSCTADADVAFHRVNDNGHAWPGGRPGREGAAVPTAAFDASAEMWRFFAAHRRR